MKNKELGIYIHIPFCKSKCYYCDFISYTNKENYIEEYIKNIIEELKQYDLSNYNITTIYIGGGTPSFINEKYIVQLLRNLKTKLSNNQTNFENMEITIEINPGTITKNKIEQYKKAGINRVSIGLQSTDNDLLKQIGRIHTYEEFLEAYEIIKEAGFENINIDLMIGLPNQTIQMLKTTLEEIKKLNPAHISVYSLIVEENTKIEKMIEKGELQLPDENSERQMYWYVKNTLELNGYKHYEISNFAKEGKQSKHNLNCWEQKEYIGLGASAHSYLNNVRYSNSAFSNSSLSNSDFINEENWNYNNKTIEEQQTSQDQKREYMLLGLRKIDGVSINQFKQKFIENPIYLFRKEIQKLVEEKLIEVDGDNIHLTNKGLDLANLVWEEFI